MNSDTVVNSPFAVLSVLDLTSTLAGAYCTMLLGDAGAQVTSVPMAGPGSEPWEAAWVPRTPAVAAAMRAAVGRGKRVLDLRPEAPADRQQLAALAEAADVIVDSRAAPVLDGFGTGYQALRGRRPQLVTAAITMWAAGAAEPLAGAASSSLVAEAEASLLARPRSDGAPVALGFPAAEMVTGLAAYGALMTAVFEARRTGRGRHLDLSMISTMLAMNSINITGAQIPAPAGHGTAGYGVFKSSDGYIILGVNTDTLWALLCTCMERPDLVVDPLYQRYQERDRRVPEVNAIISEWTAGHTSDRLVELIGPSGVPVGKILDAETAHSSPHLRRLGYFRAVDTDDGRSIEVPANPMGREPAAKPIGGPH